MDEIIGLLFLVVPVIFSLIGQKLEKAGKGSAAELPKPHVQEREPEEAQRSVTRRIQPARSEIQVKAEKARANMAFASPVVEAETHRKKDPIDPKKLVIYSEIMKPKFKE